MVAWRIILSHTQRTDDVSVHSFLKCLRCCHICSHLAQIIIDTPQQTFRPHRYANSFHRRTGLPRVTRPRTLAPLWITFRTHYMLRDQEHISRLFESTCREVGTLGVGVTARSSKLAVALGEKLLNMPRKPGDDAARLSSVIENLSRKFHSHAHPIGRKEATDILLPVNKERDPVLEKLMWDVWLDLEEELKERTPFSRITGYSA